MPVTFISHGYDTTSGNPYNEDAWALAHPVIGACAYGVQDAGDWKVSAVTGADRTVSVAPGFGWGFGVTDETATNETLQLDAIVSGVRWDLIAVRRDWTPTAGETKFVIVKGGTGKSIPGGRLSAPGGIDDQPIALVQVTAGQTQPTAIVDLRVWAGNGGAVAKDVLVLGYLARIGAHIKIGGATWRYELGTNDTPGWTSTAAQVQPIVLAAGYGPFGGGYDPSVHTEKHDFGRVYSEGAVGTTATTINVDKTSFRYKLGDVAAGHRPPYQKIFTPPSSPQLGVVTVYVYTDGVVEWECTKTAVLPKTGANGFYIALDGLSWPVA